MRTIIHVDMDAFYASVEQRNHPELRGRPVIVGGPSKRGVVSAASYEARTFGVHSAMPMAEALRRCPQAAVVGGSMSDYAAVSTDIFEIFRRYTPLVEGLSLDEAFLDVTGSRGLFGDGVAIAQSIRAAIKGELELTASAGVAHNKFLAKIASDFDKPDGLTLVPEDPAAFLAPLPIERMWGIGPVAAKKLHSLNLRRIGDLANAEVSLLEMALGKWGLAVKELAQGIDHRPVVAEHHAKSIGAEQTFEQNLHTKQDLERALLAQCQRVARRLHAQKIYATKLSVKIKYADFSVKSAQAPLDLPVYDTKTLHLAACSLLKRLMTGGKAIRLTGISAGGLTESPGQLQLFDNREHDRRNRIEDVAAAINQKFGKAALTRAELLEQGEGVGMEGEGIRQSEEWSD